jgi:hypothetical protein
MDWCGQVDAQTAMIFLVLLYYVIQKVGTCMHVLRVCVAFLFFFFFFFLCPKSCSLNGESMHVPHRLGH